MAPSTAARHRAKRSDIDRPHDRCFPDEAGFRLSEPASASWLGSRQVTSVMVEAISIKAAMPTNSA